MITFRSLNEILLTSRDVRREFLEMEDMSSFSARSCTILPKVWSSFTGFSGLEVLMNMILADICSRHMSKHCNIAHFEHRPSGGVARSTLALQLRQA